MAEAEGHKRAALYALAAILAVAALLRLVAMLETPVVQPLRADALQYYAAAHNLRTFGVYSTGLDGLLTGEAPAPNAARSPGYPLFLTLLIGTQPTQQGLDRVLLAQVLLGTLSVALVFALTRRLYDARWGLVAALLTAFSPHLVNIGVYLLTETLLSVMLVAFVWVAAMGGGARNGWWPVVSGALLGGAALVHPTFELFIVPWLLLLLLSHRGRRRWGVALAALLGFSLVFGPWVARNQLVLEGAGERAIINTVHHGLYPDFRYQGRDESYGFPYRFDPRSPEISADLGSTLNEAKRRFVDEPLRHLGWFLIGKPVALWSWDSVQGIGDSFIYEIRDTPYLHQPGFAASHGVMRLLHWPLVLLGTLGAILVWLPSASRRLSPGQVLGLRTLSLLLIYATAVHMVGAPFPRYATPLRPLLHVLALAPLFLLTVIPGAVARPGRAPVIEAGAARRPDGQGASVPAPVA